MIVMHFNEVQFQIFTSIEYYLPYIWSNLRYHPKSLWFTFSYLSAYEYTKSLNFKNINSTHYKAVYSSLGYTFYSNTYNKNCLPYHNTCEVHYEWVRSGMFVSWWTRCHHICRNHQRIILWVCLAKHVIHYNSQPKVYEYNKHLIWN